MRQFELKRTLFGADITAQIAVLDEGVQVSVFGGTRSHIGAVSVVSFQGEITTRQFPTHKDGVVSERWARTLSEAGCRPAVVTAGIHYDHLSQKQIAEVVELTDGMLSELLCLLREADIEAGS